MHHLNNCCTSDESHSAELQKVRTSTSCSGNVGAGGKFFFELHSAVSCAQDVTNCADPGKGTCGTVGIRAELGLIRKACVRGRSQP